MDIISEFENGDTIARIDGFDMALYAAAPELLAALIELQQMVEAGENNEGTHETVRNAITKAKGA